MQNILKYPRCGKTNKFLNVAIKTAKGAGSILMNLRRKRLVKYKSDTSLLTQADLISEKFIKKELKKAFPWHNILSEEAGLEKKKSAYTWIIDPIDGTTNYFRNLFVWCISIGLVYRNEVIVAVIFDPVRKEMFHAVKGHGAFLNGKKIRVGTAREPRKSLIFLAGVRTNTAKERLSKAFGLGKSFGTVRILGTIALQLCYLADNRGDGIYAIESEPWDRGTGLFIAKEAGAKIIYLKKGRDIFSPQTFVAANSSKLAKEIRKLVV